MQKEHKYTWIQFCMSAQVGSSGQVLWIWYSSYLVREVKTHFSVVEHYRQGECTFQNDTIISMMLQEEIFAFKSWG